MTHSPNRRQLLKGGAGAGALVLTGALPRPAPVSGQTMTELASLPLRERIALLFMYPVTGTTLSDEDRVWLQRDKPGGVILLGANMSTPAGIRALVADIVATNPERPPRVAVDQEGGLVSRIPDDPAPSAPVMGTLPDAEVTADSRERAELLHDYGFAVNFAPVADIAWSADSFMAGRSFGSDPELVASRVRDVYEGVAGTGVAHVCKHFPGHGHGAVDSHTALPRVDISMADWRQTDAIPFVAAIEAGAPGVMLGHLEYSQWDATLPASLSPVAVSVLRQDLGFTGAIVTDDLGMGALSAFGGTEIVDLALAAGVDVLLYAIPPAPLRDLVGHVVERVTAGEISESRINDSAHRVEALRLSPA